MLMSVRRFTRSDAQLFNNHVLPALARFPREHDDLLRVQYAKTLPPLAAAAHRFLLLSQHKALRDAASGGAPPTAPTSDAAPATATPPGTAPEPGGAATPSGAVAAAPGGVAYDVEIAALRSLFRKVVEEVSQGDGG